MNSASSSKNWVEVLVSQDGVLTVDGLFVDPREYSDPYSAALTTIAERARILGRPLLVHGVDYLNQAESWFTLDGDGQAVVASVPQPQINTIEVPDVVVSGNPAAKPSDRTHQQADSPVHDHRSSFNLASEIAPVPGQDPMPTGSNVNLGSAEVSGVASSDAADFNTEPTVVSPDVRFVRFLRQPPTSGVRRAVFSATRGAVNLGQSAQDLEEAELIRRISRQLNGSFNTAVLSLKGGIGKTSTTVGVGMILAEYRGDPPCVIDANPDSGDLAERALGEQLYFNTAPSTVTDIVRDVERIDSLTTLSRYLHHAGRLHVVAGEQDPALSDALTAEDYLRVQRLVAKYYSVVLTDCGTGVSHPAMAGILSTSTNLVIASSFAVSGAKRAKSTLQWLAGHGYERLARNAVVVITDKDQVSSRVDRKAIESYLEGQCKTVITVPHDRGVADGDKISLDHVSRRTKQAYMEIAAAIVDGYH